MTFEELGAALRSEREKRRLGIDDVANQLKINPRLLCALEAGDSRALPHPAYVRGFIRSYARLLGIGNDEIQAWFAELGQNGETRPEKPQAPVADVEYIPSRSPKKHTGRAIFALIFLLALAAAGYWIWQLGKLPFLEVSSEKPAEIVKNLPGADSWLADREENRKPGPKPQAAKPEVIPAPLEIPGQKPSDLPKPAGATVAPERRSGPETAATEAEGPGPAPRAEGPEQHKLIIIATEECWVHSSADKTDTRQFSLRKGDTFALTFAKNLELKLGNAGGVRLRYDGADLPPPGTSGQVRTLSFPPKEN